MPHFPHLLAAGDWIQLLFIVVFFIIPVLSKLLGGGDGDVPKPKRVERRPVRPQQPKPVPPPGQQVAAGEQRPANALEAEIEAFLRRARGEQPKPQPQPEPKPAPAEQVRRLVKKPRSIKQQTAPSPPRESVADHVERHISSRPVTESSRDLGKSVGKVDEAMESHLHDVFDHKLGTLPKEDVSREIPQGTDAVVWETAESKREKRAGAAEDRAAMILNMLGNRESIKHAIILGEVLKRPDFD